MSTNQSTAFAESNQSHPIKIQIARDEEAWEELNHLLDTCVSEICGDFDEPTIRSFMLVIDLVSNPNFDQGQRALAAERVQQAAFAHTRKAAKALVAHLNEINPGRIIRRRRVVAHA